MDMQNTNAGKPIRYPFLAVPECSDCGMQMRVTAACITALQQDVTFECFACLKQVHRSSVDRQG